MAADRLSDDDLIAALAQRRRRQNLELAALLSAERLVRASLATQKCDRKTMSYQQPSVCRQVHYVSYGTPGGEYTSQCRAATITEVDPQHPEHVGLVVMNPTGLFFHSLADGGSDYDAGGEVPYAGGTWHWPERV